MTELYELTAAQSPAAFFGSQFIAEQTVQPDLPSAVHIAVDASTRWQVAARQGWLSVDAISATGNEAEFGSTDALFYPGYLRNAQGQSDEHGNYLLSDLYATILHDTRTQNADLTVEQAPELQLSWAVTNDFGTGDYELSIAYTITLTVRYEKQVLTNVDGQSVWTGTGEFMNIELTEDGTTTLSVLDSAPEYDGDGSFGSASQRLDTAVGTPGDDIVDLLDCADTYFARGGNDVVSGGLLGDRIMGEAGNDMLSGGQGDDHMSGGDGADTLGGDAGEDILKGDAGNDWLWGGAGLDSLEGGDGDDMLAGQSGDDHLDGQEGNDMLHGGEGNDVLVAGGNGINQLGGDAGEDLLLSAYNYDHMWGGDGADRFQLGWWSWHDLIYDFEDGVDRIDLSEGHWYGSQWWYSSINQMNIVDDAGGNAFISLGQNTWISLYGVSAAQLDDGDFIFS